jgi:hypothetical protein
MIASKVICDDTYSNKSWSIVGQGMFQLREINQMEREMCQYLDWELNIKPSTLTEFEDMVRKDFAEPGPYPTYVLQTIPKLAATSTNPFPTIAPNISTSPIPSFGPHQASPPKSTPPPPLIPTNPAKAYLTPPHHTRYTRTVILGVNVTRFIGLATDACGDDRRQRQDRLA